MLIIIFTFIFTMKLAISGYTISKFETPGGRGPPGTEILGLSGMTEPTLVISMGCLWGLGMSTKISGVRTVPHLNDSWVVHHQVWCRDLCFPK